MCVCGGSFLTDPGRILGEGSGSGTLCGISTTSIQLGGVQGYHSPGKTLKSTLEKPGMNPLGPMETGNVTPEGQSPEFLHS